MNCFMTSIILKIKNIGRELVNKKIKILLNNFVKEKLS